jgi:hypothetical protein
VGGEITLARADGYSFSEAHAGSICLQLKMHGTILKDEYVIGLLERLLYYHDTNDDWALGWSLRSPLQPANL